MTDRAFRSKVKEIWHGRSPHRLRSLRRLLSSRQVAKQKHVHKHHCIDCGEPVKGTRCFMHSTQHRYHKKQLAV